ncbi:MAG: hypothetical protein R3D71_06970 [Rickettsiales bacterium]
MAEDSNINGAPTATSGGNNSDGKNQHDTQHARNPARNLGRDADGAENKQPLERTSLAERTSNRIKSIVAVLTASLNLSDEEKLHTEADLSSKSAGGKQITAKDAVDTAEKVASAEKFNPTSSLSSEVMLLARGEGNRLQEYNTTMTDTSGARLQAGASKPHQQQEGLSA